MKPATIKIKKDTVKVLDSLLSEFGQTLPCNFANRIIKISDIYFNNYIEGINMWYELCMIASWAERNLSSTDQTRIQVMTLRNFIYLNLIQ